MRKQIAKDKDEEGEWITVLQERKQFKNANQVMISTTIDHHQRSYADLPKDILSSIVGRLTTRIDFLSFRGTCKDFRSVSSDALSKFDWSRSSLWLLFLKAKSSGCILYNKVNDKSYTRNVPDLEGAYILGSDHGWLLVFKDKSIFFLSPFSLTKIALPDFPRKNTNNHIAAFSDVPTSSQCVISIFSLTLEEKVIEVNMIRKGQRAWTRHLVRLPDHLTYTESPLNRAIYDHKTQAFYFIHDLKHYGLKVDSKDAQCIPMHFETISVSMSFRTYSYIVKRGGSISKHCVGLKEYQTFKTGGICEQYVQLNDPSETGFHMVVSIPLKFFQASGNQNHHW